MRRHFVTRIATVAVGLAVLLLPAGAMAGESGNFQGTWTASGKWESLKFMEGREVFTLRIAGHVNLKDNMGKTKDYWGECLGLWDSREGGTARCVWKDPGSETAAYIVLDGRVAEKGAQLHGQIIGGTGDLTGVTGEVTFSWSTLFRDEANHIFSGYSVDLHGSYLIPE